MQSDRLDYAYRLSAARLVIVRLRFARRWQRLFQSTPSLARTNALRALAGMAMLVAVSGSAWLGYRAGQQVEVDTLVQTDPAPAPVTAPPVGQNTPGFQVAKRSEAPAPVTASVPILSSVTEHAGIDRQAGATRFAELASLRKTVAELQAQVLSLEQEATGLEVELLNQQIAFARAEERWEQASVERRVVYNITNIPVGGSVSEERIESDREEMEFPPPESDFEDRAESDANDTYQQYRIVDGPAEDRIDDWVNP